mmetsp:Transcript_102701/g.203915  ORF Transcript_102701/g.203915 Transcript_102701/m.203915 type:complete len:268 (-) Transcript_102701:590-1393(-)
MRWLLLLPLGQTIQQALRLHPPQTSSELPGNTDGRGQVCLRQVVLQSQVQTLLPRDLCTLQVSYQTAAPHWQGALAPQEEPLVQRCSRNGSVYLEEKVSGGDVGSFHWSGPCAGPHCVGPELSAVVRGGQGAVSAAATQPHVQQALAAAAVASCQGAANFRIQQREALFASQSPLLGLGFAVSLMPGFCAIVFVHLAYLTLARPMERGFPQMQVTQPLLERKKLAVARQACPRPTARVCWQSVRPLLPVPVDRYPAHPLPGKIHQAT